MRINPFNNPLQANQLKTDVTKWVKAGEGESQQALDDFFQGNPVTRTEQFGSLTQLLADQKVVFSPGKMGQTSLEAGILLSGQALLGSSGACLSLLVKEGSLQAVFQNGEESQQLPTAQGKLGETNLDGYTVALPTGRTLSVGKERLEVVSSNEFGQIATRFPERSGVSEASPSITSVGDLGWTVGLSYLPEQTRLGEKQNESIQFLAMNQPEDNGQQDGVVYSKYGSSYTAIDANRTAVRGLSREAAVESASWQGIESDKMVRDSLKALDTVEKFLES